jgi:hypothetical protein
LPVAQLHQTVVHLPSHTLGLPLSCPDIPSRTRHATNPLTMGQPSRLMRLAVLRLRAMTKAAKPHAEGNSVNKRYSIDS